MTREKDLIYKENCTRFIRHVRARAATSTHHDQPKEGGRNTDAQLAVGHTVIEALTN